MNELQKPNDILVATLNAPNANTLDFIRNNITAENTSLLTPDQYKSTPMVLKRYTENGVFNEDKFTKDYLKAYEEYFKLTEIKSYKDLADYIEYSPVDSFRPLNGKTWDASATIEQNYDPFRRKIGYEGLNVLSENTKSAEERAQLNHIWDPKLLQFIDETPESRNLWKKLTGRTLVYAIYLEDTDEVDPMTGEMRHFRKGEWKRDKNGLFYTEFIDDEDLLNKQVVNLQDILTKENSWLNKIDFMDSDDIDKSVFGITMKTLLPTALYFIPGFGEYYAATTTVFNLLSVLPTFYKSIESIFTGEEEGPLNKEATQLENWFRKFEPSKSAKAKESFWNYESIAGLVSDVVGLLYQLRTAAKAAKWFMGEAPNLKTTTLADYTAYWEKSNKLSKALNLGYMGLISTSTVYNDALNAGYDKRTAGAVSLVTAAALFGIMNFNESANGLGTWFLDKTTGYNQAIESGITAKLAKEEMNKFAIGWKKMLAGDNKLFIDTLREFKLKLKDKAENIFVIGSEQAWKNAIVEGVEEVSEEVIQDMVKAMADVCSYMGWTKKEGSFGGWSNVFSKEGFERYIATFVGGGLGGALFVGTDKLGHLLSGTTMDRKASYELDLAILDGRGEEVIEQIKKHRNFFNTYLSGKLMDNGDTKIYMTATEGEKSQADLIVDSAIGYVRLRMTDLTRNMDLTKMSPAQRFVHETIAKRLKDSGFDENYVMLKWKNTVEETTNLQNELNTELKKTGSDSDSERIKELKDKIKLKLLDLTDWTNGEHFRDFSIAGLLVLNNQIVKSLTNLDKESYTKSKYGREYDSFPAHSDKAETTLETITKEWETIHGNQITKENMIDMLDNLTELFKAAIPAYSLTVSSWEKLEKKKLWLHQHYTVDKDGKLTTEAGYNSTLEERNPERAALNAVLLNLLPQFWTNSDAIKFDLASLLESDGAIDLSNFEKEEAEVIKAWINDLAASYPLNIWTSSVIGDLIQTINESLVAGVDNAFTRQLLDLKKKREEGKSEEKTFSINDVQFNLIQFNIQKVTPVSTLLKAKTILDIIQDDDIIDKELYTILENIFELELADLIALNEDQVNEILKTVILSDESGHQITLEDIITKNLFNGVYSFNDDTLLEINVNGEAGLVLALTNLLEALLNKTLIGTNAELFEYVDENEADVVSKVISLLNNLNAARTELQKSNVTDELTKRWQSIKGRVAKENPLLSLIKTFAKRSGIGEDRMEAITKVFLLSTEVQESSELVPFSINKDDTEFLILLANVIDFIESLVYSTLDEDDINPELNELREFADSIDTDKTEESLVRTLLAISLSKLPSISKVIRQFTEASLLEGKENYLSFSKLTSQNVLDVLSSIRLKLARLINVAEDAVTNDFAKDEENRYNFNSKYGLFLKTEKRIEINGTNYLLIALKADASPDDDKTITSLEIELRKNILAIRKAGISDEAILSALLDDPDFEDAFMSDKTIAEGVPSNGNKLSGSVLLLRVLRVMSMSPVSLQSKYVTAIEGRALYPRFDLEETLKTLIAYNANKKLYSTALTLLDQLWKDSGLPTAGKNVLINSMFVSGPGGSGKTTLVDMFISAVKPKHVILTSSTLEKITDLEKGVTLTEEQKQPNKLADDLFGWGDDIRLFSENLDSAIEEFTKFLEKKDPTENEKAKYKVTGNEARLKVNAGNLGDIELILKGNSEKFSIIKSISFSEETIASIKNSLKDVAAHDTAIIVDEATTLNPLSILILDTISSNSENNNLLFLGDETQIGNTITIKELLYPFTISSFSLFRPHLLNGSIRFNNTSLAYNAQYLYNIARGYVEYTREYEYDTTETDGISGGKKELLNKIKDESTNSSLNLKGKLLYNEDKLFGTEIVKDESDFDRVLEKISEKVKEGNSLTLVLEHAEDERTIKDKLKSYGLTDKLLDSIKVRSLKTILGAESDYVVLYNLTAPTSNQNGDIDIKRIYTAATRSKTLTLAYEPGETGLFTAYGLSSLKDQGAKPYSVSTSIFEDRTAERVAILQNLVEALKEVDEEAKVEEENTPSSEKVGIAVEEDTEEEEDDSSDSSGDEEEDTPTTITSITPTKLETKVSVTAKEQTQGELEEKQKKLAKIFGDYLEDGTGQDVAKVYMYYTRLGISRELVSELESLSSYDEIIKKIREAVTDPNELVKDLPGFITYLEKTGSDVDLKRSAVPFKELVLKFISFRNDLIFTGKASSRFGIHMKLRDNTSWSWMKPNDDLEKESVDGLETTILSDASLNGVPFFVTMALVGINTYGTGAIFSKTLFDMARDLFYGSHPTAETHLTWFGKSNNNFASRDSYLDYRELTSELRSKAISTVPSFLIKATGAVVFPLNTQILSHNLENFGEESLRGRVTVEGLLKLGYIVEILNNPTKEELSKYRYAGTWDKDFTGTTWVVVYPKSSNPAKARQSGALAHLRKSIPGTLFNALKLDKAKITKNNKLLPERLANYSLYLIIEYLAQSCGFSFDGSFYTKRFQLNGKRNEAEINKCKAFVDSLISSELFKTKYGELVGLELKEFTELFLDNKYLDGHAPEKGKSTVRHATKAELQAKTALYNVLNSPETEGYAFGTPPSDLDGAFILRAIEAPLAYLDFHSIDFEEGSVSNLATDGLEKAKVTPVSDTSTDTIEESPSGNSSSEGELTQINLEVKGLQFNGADYSWILDPATLTDEAERARVFVETYTDFAAKISLPGSNQFADSTVKVASLLLSTLNSINKNTVIEKARKIALKLLQLKDCTK